MLVKGDRGMKTIKQIFGWIFKIILYPFHLLATFIKKYTTFSYYLIPGVMILFGLATGALVIYVYYPEGADTLREQLIAWTFAMIIIIICTLILNYFLMTGLAFVLEKMDKIYNYGDAWTKRITYAELNNRKSNKQRDDQLNKMKKKQEEFMQGYTNAFFKDYNENPNSARFKDKVFFDDYKQKDYEKEEQHQRYEEKRHRQEEKQKVLDYNTQLENAYITLHLKNNCSFEEVENNYRMLQEMFSMNGDNSKFDSKDAQLEIKNAYDFLKMHYNK